MKKFNKLQLLCCVIYFVSYLTRINYSAALTQIIADFNVTKDIASVAVTGSFITYGVGQILSGILGDKFKSRNIITFGLLGTSFVNLAMVLLNNINLLNLVWCFNGFFQALIWPPLVKIMAQNMDNTAYAHAVKNVNAAGALATIGVYLLVPASIHISGWRLAFVICACCGVLTSFVWLKVTKNLKDKKEIVKAEAGEKVKNKGLLILLLPILPAIILQGMLRDGVTTWVPTYIYEVFNLNASLSIVTGAILPVFSVLSMYVSTWIDSKIGNPVKTAILFFAVGFGCSALLLPLNQKSLIVSALLMALLTACMHGVNLMLVSRLPKYFQSTGKISTISGILNACTYVGSAASTYGFALLSENFGWSFTILGWAVIALLGTLLCVISLKKWNKFSL